MSEAKTPREFDAEELAQLREDMRHNPGKNGLSAVAQLHDCTERQVLDALKLDAWPEEEPPRPKPEPAARQRRAYPAELKEAAINALLDGGESYAAVARRAVYGSRGQWLRSTSTANCAAA